jgi:hypothetical protein
MKTKLSFLRSLNGKFGRLAAQTRKSGSSLSRISIPYSVSQEPRTAAQKDIHTRFILACNLWNAATQEQKNAWNSLGASLQISGWNYLVKITVPISESRYGTAKYGTGKYS